MSKICICMLSEEQPPTGGVGTYVWNLSRGLSRLGCEVFLVTIGSGNSSLIHEETLHEYRIVPIDLPVLRTLDFGKKARSQIKKFCRENAVDIMHSNIPLFSDCVITLEYAGRIPIVSTVHSLYRRRMENFFTNPLTPFYIQLERMCMKKADMLIAVCKAMAAGIENYGVSRSRIGTIYNGVDTEKFDPNTSGKTVLERFGIRSSERILLYVGRVGDRRKGLPFLLRSLKVLQEKENVRLLVVGGGDIDEARVLAKRLSVERSVTFAGHVGYAEMPSIYAACDIFVLPSLSEGFPFTLLEALSMAKPVVASEIPGVDEIIRDGENGMLVKPGSSSAIGDAVMKLLRNEELAERLGANGRGTILENFTLDDMSRRTYALFSEVITK